MAKKSEIIKSNTSAVSSNSSYLEWGPVWAGALIAIAITTILIQFGASVGLSMGDAIRSDDTISYNFIVVALWLILVAVCSSAAAGYVAGRMRMTMNDAVADEVEFRDGIHGITAWALATVIVAFVASIVTGISSMVAVDVVTPVAEQLSVELQNVAANQALIVAFATAAGSALGAATAWFASVAGGEHRDEGTSFHNVVPLKFRKK